jgi:hypothetical protein
MTPNTAALMIRYFSFLVDLVLGAGLIWLGFYLVENYHGVFQWRGLLHWKSLLHWAGYVVGVVGAGLALWGIIFGVWNTAVLVIFGLARAASEGWHAGRER